MAWLNLTRADRAKMKRRKCFVGVQISIAHFRLPTSSSMAYTPNDTCPNHMQLRCCDVQFQLLFFGVSVRAFSAFGDLAKSANGLTEKHLFDTFYANDVFNYRIYFKCTRHECRNSFGNHILRRAVTWSSLIIIQQPTTRIQHAPHPHRKTEEVKSKELFALMANLKGGNYTMELVEQKFQAKNRFVILTENERTSGTRGSMRLLVLCFVVWADQAVLRGN